MSTSRSWVRRVLVGILLAGVTVTAAADPPYYVLPDELLAGLYKFLKPSRKIAAVIVIDDNGDPDYLFPSTATKFASSSKLLPSKDEVGHLINLDSIAIAVTSHSPNCVWIRGAGGWYYVCL